MKKLLLISILVCLYTLSLAQTNKWFSSYNDSSALVADANKLIQQMADRIYARKPGVDLREIVAIKNTTPYLIFIKANKVNLPFWTEVITPQKKFFSEIAGGANEGRAVFGLFFNGFYLAHEIGHSFFTYAGKSFENAYDSEYAANTLAILYWRSIGEKKNLKKCYDYARKMLQRLKNPVPKNEDYKKYITQNYEELAADPYKYGYIQFAQFVEIYESKQLPDFDNYIKKD